MLHERAEYFRISLLLSVIFHGTLAFYLLFRFQSAFDGFGMQQIYSVSLEGGQSLGGLAQVAKEKDKADVAPPKKVQEPVKSEAEPAKVPEPKTEEPKKSLTDDAEVSLAEKKKIDEERRKVEAKAKAQAKAAEEAKKKEAEAKKKKELEVKKKKESSPEEINKRLQQAMQRYQGESTEAGGKGFGAGAIGGTKMGGGLQRPPEFFTYRDLLKSVIKSGWRWNDTSAPLICQVEFSLSERGEISNVTIAKSSGNSGYDDSVVRAVIKANPVEPPPASVYQFFQRVRMTFNPQE